MVTSLAALADGWPWARQSVRRCSSWSAAEGWTGRLGGREGGVLPCGGRWGVLLAENKSSSLTCFANAAPPLLTACRSRCPGEQKAPSVAVCVTGCFPCQVWGQGCSLRCGITNTPWQDISQIVITQRSGFELNFTTDWAAPERMAGRLMSCWYSCILQVNWLFNCRECVQGVHLMKYLTYQIAWPSGH